jgi:hypothetical protein
MAREMLECVFVVLLCPAHAYAYGTSAGPGCQPSKAYA